MKTETERNIRRLRKKLRQIENLERLDRDLAPEEEYKVLKKDDFRAELQELLASYLDEDGGPMSTGLGPAAELSDSLETTLDDSVSGSRQNQDTAESDPEQELQDNYVLGVTEEVTDVTLDLDNPVSPSPEPANVTLLQYEPNSLDEKTAVNSENVKNIIQSDKKPIAKNIPKQAKESKEKKDDAKLSPLTLLKKHWRERQWKVTRLVGHNDLICSASIYQCMLLTGSRDTTVRLWDLSSLEEVCSMGGHTGSVTCVLIVQAQHAQLIAERLTGIKLPADTCLGISASQDCSIKIWRLDTGLQIHSIYAYSPVTKIVFFHCDNYCCLLSATSGGKLELWDLLLGTTLDSVMAHEDSITGLQMEGDYVYTSSSDGIINAYQMRDLKLSKVFESENIKLSTGLPLHIRNVLCLQAAHQKVYYGDDAMNIKVIDWKKGEAHKLTNHTTEFGATDALHISLDLGLLLASGYDLDNGLGFINVRHLPDEKYLCSLCDETTGRIVEIVCTQGIHGDGVTIVTCGMELCVWRQLSNQLTTTNTQRSQYVSQFSRLARHSDVDSDTDADDSDTDRDTSATSHNDSSTQNISPPFVHKSHVNSNNWCSIL